MITVKFEGKIGEHISEFAERMVERFRATNSYYYNIETLSQSVLYGDFNGITLEVHYNTTPEQIVEEYSRKIDEQHQKWINSDEYKGLEAKRQDEIDKMNADVPFLMDEFEKISIPDTEYILDWICKIHPYVDRIGVNVPKDRIVSKLVSLSYLPNVNTGDNFEENDKENHARYIIGQALDGLSKGESFHPMVVMFAEHWKNRFGIAS